MLSKALYGFVGEGGSTRLSIYIACLGNSPVRTYVTDIIDGTAVQGRRLKHVQNEILLSTLCTSKLLLDIWFKML